MTAAAGRCEREGRAAMAVNDRHYGESGQEMRGVGDAAPYERVQAGNAGRRGRRPLRAGAGGDRGRQGAVPTACAGGDRGRQGAVPTAGRSRFCHCETSSA